MTKMAVRTIQNLNEAVNFNIKMIAGIRQRGKVLVSHEKAAAEFRKVCPKAFIPALDSFMFNSENLSLTIMSPALSPGGHKR